MRILKKGLSSFTLSVEDQDLAGRATARYPLNRELGTKFYNWTKLSPAEKERQEIGGEIAFIRLAGGVPTYEHLVRKENWVGTVNWTLPDGRTVGVNTRPEAIRSLLVPLSGSSRPRLYVLMTGEFPTYTFRGWELAEEVCRARHRENIRTASYAVGQYALKDDLEV